MINFAIKERRCYFFSPIKPIKTVKARLLLISFLHLLFKMDRLSTQIVRDLGVRDREAGSPRPSKFWATQKFCAARAREIWVQPVFK